MPLTALWKKLNQPFAGVTQGKKKQQLTVTQGWWFDDLMTSGHFLHLFYLFLALHCSLLGSRTHRGWGSLVARIVLSSCEDLVFQFQLQNGWWRSEITSKFALQFQDFNSDVEKQTPLNLKVSFPTNLFAIDRSGPPWTSRYFEPKHLFHQPLWFPSFRRQIAFHVLQHVPSKTLMHPLGSKKKHMKSRAAGSTDSTQQAWPCGDGNVFLQTYYRHLFIMDGLQVSVHPFAPKDPTLFAENHATTLKACRHWSLLEAGVTCIETIPLASVGDYAIFFHLDSLWSRRSRSFIYPSLTFEKGCKLKGIRWYKSPSKADKSATVLRS